MAPLLTVTPNPAALGGTVVSVSGSGFANRKTKLLLDGVGTNIFRPRSDGTFAVGITVRSTAGTQALVCQQCIGNTWSTVETETITVSGAPPAPSGDYPVTRSALTAGFGDTIPALPGYLSPITDTAWNTTITRISNVAGRRHAYSRYSAWNSDSSKLLLAFAYPGRMLNGTTYADIGSFSHIAGAIWSNTDNNKLYGTGTNILYSQNATTAALTAVHTFAGYTSVQIGGDSTGAAAEGGISDDDRYICLTGYNGSAHLISYDKQTDTILGDIVAPAGLDNAQISRKGNYVVVVASGGTRRYVRDLSSYITLTPSTGHGDNALDAAGNEIYVACATSTGTVSFRLSTGTGTNLLPSFGPNTYFNPGHVSGRNRLRPGWIYLSSYDYTFYGGNNPYPGRDQVVAVKTDGSGQVEVYGYAHAHYNGAAVYASQPHMTPSPDGARVLFASAWGTSSGGSVYAYIAEAAP